MLMNCDLYQKFPKLNSRPVYCSQINGMLKINFKVLGGCKIYLRDPFSKMRMKIEHDIDIDMLDSGN